MYALSKALIGYILKVILTSYLYQFKACASFRINNTDLQHLFFSDTIHRKVKPVPLSHSKLKKKQDELIHRGDVQRTEFKATRLNQRHLRQKSGQNSRHHADRRSPSSPSDRKMSAKRGVFGGHGKAVLTEFELPSDFFSEYTVAELEQTAMQYAVSRKSKKKKCKISQNK